jgi:parallel beta-helix repeat protein
MQRSEEAKKVFGIKLFTGLIVLLMINIPVHAAPSAYDKNTILCDHDFNYMSSFAEAEIQTIFDSRNSFFKDYVDSSTNKRASWVIADRSQQYQISSCVLLAKMQAESSSVWAYKDMNEHIYNDAGIDMGTRADWVLFYGWSDTIIYPQYKGFYKQVDNAAKSLSEWFANPSSKGWEAYKTHSVMDGTVTSTNNATCALYIYTPWISSNKLLYQVWWMMFKNTGTCIDTLNILSPTQTSSANAGDYSNPSHIDAIIEVKEGVSPITGLTDTDFTFKIDGKTAAAILIDNSVPGQYVFDVTPPKQGSTGKYDLEVWARYRGSTFKDTEQEAVTYTWLEAKPVLTSPLKITPEKDKYYVGDFIRAEFTVKNVGGAPTALDKLLVGGRFNDGMLPNGEYPDFTSQTTTLQPDGQYIYTGTLTLTQPGNYHFFITYYIENPTSEEKKLLDGNNWNTCVGLGKGLTDADRIEDIRVFLQLERNVLSVPDGHPTIQAAVNAASAGDTIIVKDGIYYENVDVTKSLTIRSTSGNHANTIVQAKYPGDEVFYVTADYVNISGFTVEGATQRTGISLFNSDYCNISSNKCSYNWYGITLYYSSNNTISGNDVSDNSYDGISLKDSSNNTISGNDVSDNSYDGITLANGRSRSSNTITGNNVCNNGRGITLHYSSNNTVSRNTFINNGLVVSESSYHNAVEDNTVNNKPLVFLEGASDYKVKDAGQVILINCRNIKVENLNLSNTCVGIELLATEDSIIADNTVSNNNWYGITLYSSSNNTIYLRYSSNNNTITGNNVSSNNDGISLYDSSNNNTITGNNVSSNNDGIRLFLSSNNKIYLNNLINNADTVDSYESTNIWNSPLEITYTYDGTTYESYLGNYWDDYEGTDANGDGIGDNPYPINSDKDNYPLMKPFENYIEFK